MGAYIMGDPVRELEQELASYVGVKHCLTCANGTDALTLALKALGVGRDDIVFVPEVGQLYYGRVVRLMQFGAFVELAPGKDGLVHISKLDDKRVEKVEDVVNIGDMIWVKVTEIDEKGRVNLSRKDALKEIAAKEANGEIVK